MSVIDSVLNHKRICAMDTLFRSMPAHADSPNDRAQHYLHSVLVARVAQRSKINPIVAGLMFDGNFIKAVRAKEIGLVDELM
jgi:hypothetical protein